MAIHQQYTWAQYEVCDSTSQKTYSLPTSHFSPDSTIINVKIMNYEPKYAEHVSLGFYCANDSTIYSKKLFEISPDGDVCIAIQPFYPQTAQLKIGENTFKSLVVTPGGNLFLLFEMKNSSNDIDLVCAKGTFDDVIMDINTSTLLQMIKYHVDTASIDSVILSDKSISSQVESIYYQYRDSINQNRSISSAAKEWFNMYNETQFFYYISKMNNLCVKRILHDLESINSAVLKNPSARYALSTMNVITDTWGIQKKISSSSKMTVYPYFTMFWDGIYKDEMGNRNQYNYDIEQFSSAMRCKQYGEDEMVKKLTESIQDEVMKSYLLKLYENK